MAAVVVATCDAPLHRTGAPLLSMTAARLKLRDTTGGKAAISFDEGSAMSHPSASA
jgi:hypothetical protein